MRVCGRDKVTYPFNHPETVYVAGPMRYLPEFNYPAFDAATTFLRLMGWKVHSPAEMSREMGFHPGGLTGYEMDDHRENALRKDIGILIDEATTGIVLLDAWSMSVGAKTEYVVAKAVGLKIWSLYEEEDGLQLHEHVSHMVTV